MTNINKYLLSITFIFIVSLSIAYSSFNEELIVNGEAYVRVPEDIRITKIQMLNATNQGYETYKSNFSKNSISCYVTLPNLNSTVTYRFYINNNSNKLYVIEELADSLSNQNITYTIDDFSLGHVITAKTEEYIDITFSYKSGVTSIPTERKQIASIAFTFTVPYASIIKYDNSKSGTTCVDVQCTLDELYSKL